eukprot:GDKJ01038070.1.p1 GENE.GDKJ01038070.1~~GDKJ01038070.1.p1  ORF type:complete len:527 (+),score=147.70 GDKJ01038070.1:186-1583(+)
MERVERLLEILKNQLAEKTRMVEEASMCRDLAMSAAEETKKVAESSETLVNQLNDQIRILEEDLEIEIAKRIEIQSNVVSECERLRVALQESEEKCAKLEASFEAEKKMREHEKNLHENAMSTLEHKMIKVTKSDQEKRLLEQRLAVVTQELALVKDTMSLEASRLLSSSSSLRSTHHRNCAADSEPNTPNLNQSNTNSNGNNGASSVSSLRNQQQQSHMSSNAGVSRNSRTPPPPSSSSFKSTNPVSPRFSTRPQRPISTDPHYSGNQAAQSNAPTKPLRPSGSCQKIPSLLNGVTLRQSQSALKCNKREEVNSLWSDDDEDCSTMHVEQQQEASGRSSLQKKSSIIQHLSEKSPDVHWSSSHSPSKPQQLQNVFMPTSTIIPQNSHNPMNASQVQRNNEWIQKLRTSGAFGGGTARSEATSFAELPFGNALGLLGSAAKALRTQLDAECSYTGPTDFFDGVET